MSILNYKNVSKRDKKAIPRGKSIGSKLALTLWRRSRAVSNSVVESHHAVQSLLRCVKQNEQMNPLQSGTFNTRKRNRAWP